MPAVVFLSNPRVEKLIKVSVIYVEVLKICTIIINEFLFVVQIILVWYISKFCFGVYKIQNLYILQEFMTYY